MKKHFLLTGLCVVTLLAGSLQAQACKPCPNGVRPVPYGAQPAPVTPPPVAPGVGGNVGGGNNQVVWDLPAEEKARIRAAAKFMSNNTVRVNGQIVRKPGN